MPRLTAFGEKVANLNALLEAYPKSEFASPCRSTVPLLDYWRFPERRVDEFTSLLGLTAESAEFHFEYKVPVQAGRGKASHTDLMLLTSEHAVAIEAKFTEPRYENVSAWLRDPPEGNRSDVLSGWLTLIETQTGCRLAEASIAELPYQLIHRTASACAGPRVGATVVYQIFDPRQKPYYESILSALAGLFGAASPAFYIVACQFETTARYDDLVGRWRARSSGVAEAVVEALASGPLLEFGTPELWSAA